MKLFLMSLLIAGAPQWLTSSATRAGDEHRAVNNQVVVVTGEDASEPGAKVLKLGADAAGNVMKWVIRDGDSKTVAVKCKKCKKGAPCAGCVKIAGDGGEKVKVFTIGLGDDADDEPVVIRKQKIKKCEKARKAKKAKKAKRAKKAKKHKESAQRRIEVFADEDGEAKVIVYGPDDALHAKPTFAKAKKCAKCRKGHKCAQCKKGKKAEAKVIISGLGEDFDFDFDFDHDFDFDQDFDVHIEPFLFKSKLGGKGKSHAHSGGHAERIGKGEGKVDVYVTREGKGRCTCGCKCCGGEGKVIKRKRIKHGDDFVNIHKGHGLHEGHGPKVRTFFGSDDDDSEHSSVIIKRKGCGGDDHRVIKRKRIKLDDFVNIHKGHGLHEGHGPKVMTFFGSDDDDSDEGQVWIERKKGEGKGWIELMEADDPGDNLLITALGEGPGDGRSEPGTLRWVSEGERPEGGAFLGVSLGDVPEALDAQFGLDGLGVFVLSVVDDSPADEAGLEVHDVILAIDGERVKGTAQAGELIKSHDPGDEVDIVVLRDGRKKTVSAELGAREAPKKQVKARKKVKVPKREKAPRVGAWLGVSIGEVPEALAAQLDIDEHGILVVNVADDSPADEAGIEVHDIIISFDGEGVTGDTGQAVGLIKTREPGEEVEIDVLRDGEKETLTVQLGSLADLKSGKIEWKAEGAPRAEVEERVRTRAKMLRKGPGGKWVLKDLGDLEELKELPKHLQMIIPKSGERTIQLYADGGTKKITVKTEEDGRLITIHREGDGPIVVEKVDEDGHKSKVAYENGEELREADEEAYELWQKADESVVVELDFGEVEIPDIEIPEIKIPDIEIPGSTFEFDADEWREQMEEWKEHAEEWREHLDESLGEAGEARERAMQALQEALEQLRELQPERESEYFKALPFKFFGEGTPFGPRHFGKPRQSFEVRADGTIEVRIRKGDTEVVRLFEGEDDLARRSPKLYKKFEALMAVEDEDE